jgi:hypothetical protein
MEKMFRLTENLWMRINLHELKVIMEKPSGNFHRAISTFKQGNKNIKKGT